MSLTVTTPNIYNDLRRPVRFRVASDLMSKESYDIDSSAPNAINSGSTNTFYLLKSTYPTLAIQVNDLVKGSGFTDTGTTSANSTFRIINIDTSDATWWILTGTKTLEGSISYTATHGTLTRANDVRLKVDLTVSGSLLTTYYLSYSGVSYVDVYVQRYLEDLIEIGTIPSLSAFGSILDNEKLLKTFSVLFTEQQADEDGNMTDRDTYSSSNFYGIDALRPIEDSNINDHIIVAGFQHSFLTDRNYIRIRQGDVYHLSFVTSETTVRIKTFEGSTMIDSRDVTPTNGYVTYSFVGGSSNRAVAIYTTADEQISEVIYFIVESNCRPDRVYYRNRWGGYDMDYVNVEISTETKKDLIRKSLPYDYDYQTDREIEQINKQSNDSGILITERMSDLHAWQLVYSNDVYLIMNGKLYPIVITTNNLPRKSNKLISIKANFKISNNGNTYT